MADRLKVLMYYLYYKYRRPFLDSLAIRRWQEKKLSKHLKYVARHSEIYKGKTELEDYPVIDKAFMMEHFDALNTVGIRREEAEAFAVRAERERDFAPKLHGVTVGLSSGTSGRRGIFLVSDREKNRWAGYILAKFLPGSILDSLDIAFFMRADSNLYQAVSSRNIRFHFFDIYRDMAEHKARLEETKPAILVGQPSLLLMLAKEVECGTLHIFPRTVISIAEVLERKDEAYLKKAFGLEVIHQVYQCTEGCLATTCSQGTLHLNEDIVRIERKYLEGRRFIPIVTDFERKAQPIIRYRLNDILVEKKGGCSCGNFGLALEKIEGREDDMFSFVDRKGREELVFPDFIRRCVLFAEDRGGKQLLRKAAEEPVKRPVKKAAEEPVKGSAEELTEGKDRKSAEYRVVQKQDRSIVVYADLNTWEKERVLAEFARLARDRDFVLPEIRFAPYYRETGKKLKRVERERES